MKKLLQFFKNLFSGQRIKADKEGEISIKEHKMESAKIEDENLHKCISQEKSKVQTYKVKGYQTHMNHEVSSLTKKSFKRQQAYFIQVGFDFGTSYSKCICRNIISDKAWIYIPPKPYVHELPFLLPSVLLYQDGKFQYIHKPGIHYLDNGIYHMKPALVKLSLGQMDDDDPVLVPYRRICAQFNYNLHDFVEGCAVYFLACAFGMVREQIKQRFSDFGSHPDDYIGVNMAVPIADMEQRAIRALFYRILYESWILADNISRYPSLNYNELQEYRSKLNSLPISNSFGDACNIYPEVSANVQGFVRSRVASEGMYLFSDIGAATVDQSTFIFIRKPDYTDHLTYLYAKVLPLGSSQIEFLASKLKGENDLKTLEVYRMKKERGENDIELRQAKNEIATQLIKETIATLAGTKRKLENPRQMRDIKLLFGGGGHCEFPYERAIKREPFSCNLFHPPINPRIIGLPIPTDLDFGNIDEETKHKWMKRLYVAYGLSFWRGDLTSFSFPSDTEPATPRQIIRDIPEAPGKEQC